MLGILSGVLLSTSSIQALPYEVLVIGISAESDEAKIQEFQKDAARLNALHLSGYPAAKAYYNVLAMTSGQVFFVFGFRGRVQGIHGKNYPNTVKNLRRMQHNGEPKYPSLKWVPVDEIRRLLKKALLPEVGQQVDNKN